MQDISLFSDTEYDKPGEECGVFGVFDRGDNLDCSRLSYYALYALQHRGQESCGIVVNNNREIMYKKGMGLVNEVFTDKILDELKGQMAVGHVRYSTTGESRWENAQPLVSRYVKGTMAIAHNGNLVNADKLHEEYERTGAIFQTTIDSEVVAYAVARARLATPSIEGAVNYAMHQLKGSYSMIIMSPQKLIAVRDPHGIRPLCMGKIGNSTVFASETCALDAIGAEFVRNVDPGEIVIADENGTRSIRDHCGQPSHMCIFEYIYFARPDSIIEGQSVYAARKEAGKILAQEHPVEADLVIGVPDSGLAAAVGYSLESQIPYETGLIKNRYIGRTFIQPLQTQRENSVRIKLNALKDTVEGKRIIMIDDSIVRGTTCGRIVQLLKSAGAKEVHVRISSPPFMWPCFFGTDIPDRDQLVAFSHSVEETRQLIGADSLGYLSLENVQKIAPNAQCGFCDACFSGNYPIDVPPIK
jgi:amidophosphoribosyltransferase